MSLLFSGGGAYGQNKNTSARLCAKNAWEGGAYLRDTTVLTYYSGKNVELLKTPLAKTIEVIVNGNSNWYVCRGYVCLHLLQIGILSVHCS